jgi:hypothetical protein
MAWSYRSLGYAAYLLPDAHPFKSYFETKLLNNLARDAEHARTSDNIFGTWYMAEGNEQYRTFYDEFFTWSLGNLVDLGFSEALPILAFKSRYPLGRMGGTSSSPNGYCFQAGPAYTHEMGPTPTTWYTSWAEVFAHNVPAECVSLTCGTTEMATCLGAAPDPNAIWNGQDAAVSYYTQMRIALAMAVQHGFGSLDEHWALFNAAATLPDFSADPRFAILPRNAP